MDGVLTVCMAAVALLVAVVVWRSGSRRRRACDCEGVLPRGTMGWPFLGETLEFMSCGLSSRPESFMDKRRLLYGKVFKSHLFGSPTVVSTDAEVSRAVLQGDAATFVPAYPKSVMQLMGESSILLINGGLQRKVHGLVGSFFKSPALKSQVTGDMQRYVEAAMEGWADGRLVHVQDEARKIGFHVLVRALTSVEPGKQMQFIQEQFHEFIAGMMSLPIKLPGTRLSRSLQAKKRIAMLVKEIIKDKRSRARDGTHDCVPRDAIDVLLNDGSEQLTDELISDNIIDFMIPGEDSVPVLITLAVKYLSDCPAALQQLEEENTQLKRSKPGETLGWADYMSLSFTQNVISETLRIGNIITGIMRKALRDVEIKGHLIPKGWCVYAYFRSVHLDGDIYDDPHKFDPWRWQQDKDAVSTASYTPFGGGQRLCPGLDLARLEASIFLHHMVTNFSWAAEEDTVVNFPTVRVKGRMPIRVKRKSQPVEQM